jgi:hypothetical protein
VDELDINIRLFIWGLAGRKMGYKFFTSSWCILETYHLKMIKAKKEKGSVTQLVRVEAC